MLTLQVLAQQRQEQARLAAETTRSAEADAPVDPASFIQSLPASLRQQVRLTLHGSCAWQQCS